MPLLRPIESFYPTLPSSLPTGTIPPESWPTPDTHKLILRKEDPKEKPKEYHWIVTTAAIAGTIIGTIATGGLLGAVVGGAILATAAVPLRRYFAHHTHTQFEKDTPSLAEEMIWTGGTQLFFGAAFGVFGVGMNFLKGAASGFLSRVAANVLAKGIVSKGGASSVEGVAQKFADCALLAKEFYKKRTTQVVLRSAAGGGALSELLHDDKGKFDPKDFKIDTLPGFLGMLYGGNAVFSGAFGANLFGLDVAVPMSLLSYKLFRWMAGEEFLDFSEFNYMEAVKWRYIAEGGNVVANIATYGRAYLRPDLRLAIAEKQGLTASKETGTQRVAPGAWMIDNTFGLVYRALPNIFYFKNVVKPQVAYTPGPWNALAAKFPTLSQRLTVIQKFKNDDMMKPVYGLTGRVMNVVYTWATVVPYWTYFAPQVGMSPGEWGANRFLKLTLFPLVGKPMKDVFGGDTMMAQYAGFAVGLAIDYGVTQFFNARYKKRHWAKNLHLSLNAFHRAIGTKEKEKIAEYVFEEIFLRQMTDWSWVSLRLGKGYYEFNEDYLLTFVDEVSKCDAEERSSLKEIYRISINKFKSEKLGHKREEGLLIFKKILEAISLL